MGKWIRFKEIQNLSGKTSRWEVMTRDGSNPDQDTGCIGMIKWFGKWRCYAFFPYPECVFEKTCLRDIAGFCETKTKEHRMVKIREFVGLKPR